MAQYSFFERKVARLLESQPMLRDITRQSYKRLIYIINKKNITLSLEAGVKLHDVAGLCNISDYDAFYFGYYDKSPWSPNQSSYLGHILRNGKCYVTLCDLSSKSHRIISETTAWNYQQGAMSQWIDNNIIIFNDYQDNQLGAKLYDMRSNLTKFLPYPVQVINPSKEEYLSLNYRRLSLLRPDYGYFKECSNFEVKQDYHSDGIWQVNYTTGKVTLLVKISDLIKLAPDQFKDAQHKVNHCYYSPDGNQFVFLHRWLDRTGKYSRLMCCDADGNNLRILLDHRMISHYSWINTTELIVWARTPHLGDSYIILSAIDGKVTRLDEGNLSRYGDGHPTFDERYSRIITDTYPDKGRVRTLVVMNFKTKEVNELGKFFSPWKFDGESRCDLHPRWSKDGVFISIDSAHEGIRKSYLVELPSSCLSELC